MALTETKLGACVFKLVKLQPSIKTSDADNACFKAKGKLSKAKEHAGITTVTRRRKSNKKAAARKRPAKKAARKSPARKSSARKAPARKRPAKKAARKSTRRS